MDEVLTRGTQLTTNTWGHTEEDFRAAGLTKGRFEPWEDGYRTADLAQDPRSFEWWYFDFQLDDGSTVVIGFNTREDCVSIGTHEGPACVRILTNLPDGVVIEDVERFRLEDISAARDRCSVRMGRISVEGDLTTYRIQGRVQDAELDLVLRKTVPTWRPGTGIIRGANPRDYLAWLCVMPEGTVEGTMTRRGVTRSMNGVCYHDRNWGSVPIGDSVHNWWWGRGRAGSSSVVTFPIRCRPQGTAPCLMVYDRDEQRLLVDACSPETLSVDELDIQEALDPRRGGQLARTVDVTWRRGADRVQTRWAVEQLLSSPDYKSLLGPKARQALVDRGVDRLAYSRFEASLTVDRELGGKKDRSSGESVFERMDYGYSVDSGEPGSGG